MAAVTLFATTRQLATDFEVGVAISEAVADSIRPLGAKRFMFQNMKASVETLVLGSSHGDHGFDPAHLPGAVNLCYRSLDHKHCYYMYRRALDLCPKLRNIVLFYSVFSPGNVLERSPLERDIGPLFSALFELDVEYQANDLNALHQAISQQLRGGMSAALDQEAARLDGYAGFFSAYKGPGPVSEFQNRMLSHIKLNYESGADYYLLKMLAMADSLGHNVHIIIPPVSSKYREVINTRSSIIFRELIDIVTTFPWRRPIKLLNGYDDECYKDEFFLDSDHLDTRGEGVQLLSRAIAEMVLGQEPAAEIAAA